MIPPSRPLVQVGDTLAGKYRVERVLGQGAMGMVVAAMHVDLHERRAIKFMLPTALGDADGIERFMREARACAKLKSKHVAAVYDVGRLESGAPYIVMEYLEGTDLKAVLQKEKALPVRLAVDYMLQALEAIGEAHQAGIVHRDLKPANMFLAAGVGGTPCIKILDFGIAKLAPSPGSGPEFQEMTTTEMIMGSPLYMSPEQMRSSRYVDARCDIWSLGVILYRMVTGTLPFQAPTAPELFAMVLKEAPARPSALNPHLPPAFEAILLRCLEKDPERRWKSAAELADALRPFAVEGATPSARELEADGTTHMWRPPQASMPDGWYGAGSGAGSDSASARRRAGAPPPASSIAQARTTMPLDQGGTMPISSRTEPGSMPGQLVQTGSNPVIAGSWPGASPPPSGQHPAMGGMPPSYPHAQPYPNPQPGMPYEAGMPGQTSGSWSRTGVGLSQEPPRSRALAIGFAIGGVFVFAGIALFVTLRGGEPAPAAAPPVAATVQVAPAPSTMEAPPSKQAPQPSAVIPAEAETATPAPALAADAPTRSQTTGQRTTSPTAAPSQTSKTAALPSTAKKPATSPVDDNPFANARRK